MLSFLALNWRWLTSGALALVIGMTISGWWYGLRIDEMDDERVVAVEAEKAACRKSLDTFRSETDAYQKKVSASNGHARTLTQRVYTATCSDLSAQAGGADRGERAFCMDRDHMAQLIELARKCESNTAAALTLDNAWK